jgi:hypothetical protein
MDQSHPQQTVYEHADEEALGVADAVFQGNVSTTAELVDLEVDRCRSTKAAHRFVSW